MNRTPLLPLVLLLLAAPATARPRTPQEPAPTLVDEPFVDRADALARWRFKHAPKPSEEELKPFGQHAMNAGFALGLGVGGEGFAMGVGGAFGYFVLDGLEPGVDFNVTFGSDQPVVVSLMGYLRWVFWRAFPFSPFLKVQGGAWFVPICIWSRARPWSMLPAS